MCKNQQPFKGESDPKFEMLVPVAGEVPGDAEGRRAALVASCSAETVKASVGKRSLQELKHTHSHIQNTLT